MWFYQLLYAVKYYLSYMALLEGKPAVVWSQKKSPINLPLFSAILWCSLQNAIMMQFHHHCFVTFWTRPWVLQLTVMKALE